MLKLRLVLIMVFVLLLCGCSALAAGPAERAVDLPPLLAPSLLCDCEQSQDFCSGSRPRTLRQHYRRYQLTVTAGARIEGHSLRWRFIPCQSTAQFATVFGISQFAEVISCWVKNPHGYEIDLMLRVTEFDGSVYQSPPVFLGDERNWRQVAFYRHDFDLAGDSFDSDRRLDWPIKRLEFRVTGLRPDDTYDLYFDQLQVYSPTTAEVTVNDWQCPGVTSAGDILPIKIQAAASAAISPLDIVLQLCRDEMVLLQAPVAELVSQQELKGASPLTPLPGGEGNVEQVISVTVTAQLPLPAYLRQGIYTVRLATGEGLKLRAAPGVELERQVGITTKQRTPVVVGMRKQGGGMVLAINDQVTKPAVVGLRQASEGICRQAVQHGLHLYALPVACGFAPYGQAADTWEVPESLDFSGIAAHIGALLLIDPQARIILQVSVESPLWWDEQHPTHVVQVPGEKITAARKSTHASWASQTWQQQASGALRRLAEDLEASAFADHIIGYQIVAGEGGRWVQWGNSQGVIDSSAAAQVAFRQWLQHKYVGLPALRVAWGQPRRPLRDAPGVAQGHISTQWSQITVPGVGQLFDPQAPALYDPVVHQPLIDYQQFVSAQVAESILKFAGVIKEATDGRKLCGVAYGHLLDHWFPPASVQLAGHLGLSRILAADHIDFVLGPAQSALFPVTALSSIQAHDKLYLAQGDENSCARLAQAAVSGAGFIYHAAEDIEPAVAALAQAQAAFEVLAEPPPDDTQQPVASVALVVDEHSATYLKPACELSRAVLTDQARQVQQAGVCVDIWLIEDLLAGVVPEYKMYIFPNAFALSRRQRQALREVLTAPTATVVWIYGAGAIDHAISGATMHEVMGIAPTVSTKPGPVRVVIPPGDPLISPQATVPLVYGLADLVAPRFLIVDKEAQSLGKLQGSSWSGLATITTEGHRSVYSVAPGLPASVLARLAQDSGISVLAPVGTQICGHEGIICVTAGDSEQITLQLPVGFGAIDLVTGAALPQQGSQIGLALRPAEALVIRLAPVP